MLKISYLCVLTNFIYSMAIATEHKWRYFFHFTYIENLDSIIKHGILCVNEKKRRGIKHVNIASDSIQERRSSMKVSCGLKGVVHDYVPFYFTSINPMLLSVINSKNQDQLFFLFFGIKIEKIEENDVVFTDASANTVSPPNFYDTAIDLDKLDWDCINSRKWSYTDDKRHKKMAEVMIHNCVPIDDIDCIVVWNNYIKDKVLKIFKDNNKTPPKIYLGDEIAAGRYKFYFTKFTFQGRGNETLVTGPYLMKMKFKTVVNSVIEKRGEEKPKNPIFNNLQDGVDKLANDFTLIAEMQGIFELETDNYIHVDTVSEHTKKVVAAIKKQEYFNGISIECQNILLISAYLHDIGKGPKSKWKNEIQKAYADHPVDSLVMLERILVEDFKILSATEIRKICLLVAYHDIIGDVVAKNRDIQQITEIIEDKSEFDMLASIGLADASAIRKEWETEIEDELPTIREYVLKNISK